MSNAYHRRGVAKHTTFKELQDGCIAYKLKPAKKGLRSLKSWLSPKISTFLTYIRVEENKLCRFVYIIIDNSRRPERS